MSQTLPELFTTALKNILSELIDGGSQGTFVLDSKSPGLLAMLEALSAESASWRAGGDRMSIAAHVNHVTFTLHVMNRWASGEENPFADADWAGSWKLQTVTEPQWRELIASLRREAHAWIDALQQPREWDEITLTGTIGSPAHIAYHLGEVRQLILAQSRAS
jgi:hypothetical protein